MHFHTQRKCRARRQEELFTLPLRASHMLKILSSPSLSSTCRTQANTNPEINVNNFPADTNYVVESCDINEFHITYRKLQQTFQCLLHCPPG